MKESDKGWKKSAKLHAALVAGLASVIIVGLNIHNENICVAEIDLCKMVISAVVVSRATLTGFQTFPRKERTFIPSSTPQEESN